MSAALAKALAPSRGGGTPGPRGAAVAGAVPGARPALDVPVGVDRAGVRYGFALILLSLLGGGLTPFLVTPRMGVGAHTLGVLGGLMLIALAAVAPAFRLSPELLRTMRGCWLSAAYLNWSGTLLAGATGASFLTPIAGAGATGSMAAEVTVIAAYVAVGVTSVAGTLIAIYGLRNTTTPEHVDCNERRPEP